MSEILSEILQFVNQIRIFHWQTKSHAKHVALGQLYEKLDESVDKFIETYQGIYERIVLQKVVIKLDNIITDQKMIQYIKTCRDKWNKLVSKQIKDTDLLNIRDEILGHINQTLYLLTLD